MEESKKRKIEHRYAVREVLKFTEEEALDEAVELINIFLSEQAELRGDEIELAVKRDRRELILPFIEHGCEIRLKTFSRCVGYQSDRAEYLPLLLEHAKPAVLKQLYSKWPSILLDYIAISRNYDSPKKIKETCNRLIDENGVDVNHVNSKYGSTALVMAIIYQTDEVIEYFLNRDDVLYEKCHPNEPRTALAIAMEFGRWEAAVSLIRKFANVDDLNCRLSSTDSGFSEPLALLHILGVEFDHDELLKHMCRGDEPAVKREIEYFLTVWYPEETKRIKSLFEMAAISLRMSNCRNKLQTMCKQYPYIVENGLRLNFVKLNFPNFQEPD
ncbi:hypothetical protein HDE_12149 [Halotydeus destructor]|nr:hypothetical protein HDE_12149 [Halotydeus destructor]